MHTIASALMAVVLVLAALLLNAGLLDNLVVEGPFAWHFRQDSAWQGAIEAGVLALLLVAALQAPPRWRLPLLLVPLLLYLRNHHVDVPALAALFQLEVMVAAGALLLGRADAPQATRLSLHLMLGIAATAAVMLLASLAGFGTAKELAVLLLGGGALVLLAARQRPVVLQVLRAASGSTRGTRVIVALLLAWIAVLLAKTNNEPGYDSLWYGLRGQWVLAPYRSLFDFTGLVSPVHYSPKLYELLLLPLNVVPDYSFATALAIMLFGALGVVLYDIARRLGATTVQAAGAAAVGLSIPAVSNLTVTSKPETLMLLLLALAVRWAIDFMRAPRWPAFLMVAACVGLASQAKLTSLPFGAAIVLACGVALALKPSASAGNAPVEFSRRIVIAMVAATAIVIVLLTARTWLLTGMPTIGPDPLVKLWQALGMHLREPVGTLDWIRPQDWSDVPTLAYDLIMRPTRLSHVVITWIGSVWLWLLLVFAAAVAVFRAPVLRRELLLVGLVLLAGLWLALGQRYIERGGDGNYFMFATLLATVVLAALALPAVSTAWRRVVAAALSLFVALHVSYAFVSTNWARAGTRAWDWHLDRSPLDDSLSRWDRLKREGLSNIEDELRTSDSTLHVVGLDMDAAGMMLSAVFESIETVSISRPGFLASPVAFRRFLDCAHVDGVILPVAPSKAPHLALIAAPAIIAWRVDRRHRVVRDDSYVLILRGSPAQARACES